MGSWSVSLCHPSVFPEEGVTLEKCAFVSLLSWCACLSVYLRGYPSVSGLDVLCVFGTLSGYISGLGVSASSPPCVFLPRWLKSLGPLLRCVALRTEWTANLGAFRAAGLGAPQASVLGAVSVFGVCGGGSCICVSLSVAGYWGLCVLMCVCVLTCMCLCAEVAGPPSCCVCVLACTAHPRTCAGQVAFRAALCVYVCGSCVLSPLGSCGCVCDTATSPRDVFWVWNGPEAACPCFLR